VLAPSELTADAGLGADIKADPVADTARDDASFMMRSFTGGEDDVSIEPLENPFPHVVRLIGSEFEPGYDRDTYGAALAGTLSRALELERAVRAANQSAYLVALVEKA
jgi:hypothetical protein